MSATKLMGPTGLNSAPEQIGSIYLHVALLCLDFTNCLTIGILPSENRLLWDIG